ncbi:hypothetical protein ACHAC9_00950 [Massilia sp. CMS3.1]
MYGIQNNECAGLPGAGRVLALSVAPALVLRDPSEAAPPEA